MFDAQIIHSMVVHFPIALIATGFAFDIVSHFYRSDDFVKVGFWNLFAGMLSIVATIITGLLADSLVGHMENPLPIFSTHGSLQFVASFLLLGILIFRLIGGGKLPVSLMKRNLLLAAHALGIGLLYYGAHLGAKLANRI